MSARAIVSRRFMPPDSGSTAIVGAVGQLHELEQLVRPLADLRARQVEVAAVDHEVVPDRQLGVEVVLLRDDAEPRTDRGPSRRGSMPSTRSSPPVSGETQPIMRIVEVLPAPFGPRNPNASPLLDVEVDAVDRDELAEALREAAGIDERAFRAGLDA